MDEQTKNCRFTKILLEAVSAWKKELRSMKFYCGSAAALILSMFAAFVVVALVESSLLTSATKLVLLFGLTVAPAIRAVSEWFATLGADFVDHFTKWYMTHSITWSTIDFSKADEKFSTRSIAPLKTPPRFALA